MSSKALSRAFTYKFQVYDRPGLTLSPSERTQLTQDLRTLAASCLDPIPDYQCLSTAPTALNDKLIVAMREMQEPWRVIAFVSAIYLQIPLAEDGEFATVLHTGLACVAPGSRRQGMMGPLFYHLFNHLRTQSMFVHGLWVTSLAEVSSSLGNIAQYAVDVYPSPGHDAPSPVHVRIAEAVSEKHRDAMLIAGDAMFDRERFVFRGSNPPGSCFRKDTEDPRYHHRDARVNEYY